jgi:hypothetical protein
LISPLGKHNIHSLGKDIGLDKFIKHANSVTDGKITQENFFELSKSFLNTHTLTNIGIRAISGVIGKVIDNGINYLSNRNSSVTPFLSSQYTRIGKKDVSYQKTCCHVGVPTSDRLKNMKNNPNIDSDQKLISSNVFSIV